MLHTGLLCACTASKLHTAQPSARNTEALHTFTLSSRRPCFNRTLTSESVFTLLYISYTPTTVHLTSRLQMFFVFFFILPVWFTGNFLWKKMCTRCCATHVFWHLFKCCAIHETACLPATGVQNSIFVSACQSLALQTVIFLLPAI